jgi:recombinational DNA repair protein RecT
MALKTVLRKISKYLPKSNELLARALDLDDRADRGVDQLLETPAGVTYIDAPDAPQKPPAASPVDRLKELHGAPHGPTTAAEPPAQPLVEPPAEGDIKW